MDLGTLRIGLAIDRGKFDNDLRKIESDYRKHIGQVPHMLIAPKVDHSELKKLNDHFALKRKDYQDLQNYFDRNPLKVRYEVENGDFTKIGRGVSRGSSRGSSRTSQGTNKASNQLSIGIRSFHTDFRTYSSASLTYQKQVAENTKSTFLGSLFTGFTENIGRDISRQFTTAFTNAGSRKVKQTAKAVKKNYVGDDFVAETFAAEVLSSGSLSKGINTAYKRSNLGNYLSQLEEVQQLATASNQERKKIIKNNPKFNELYSEILQKNAELIGGGRKNFRKIESATNKEFLQAIQPKELTQKLLAPVIKEFQPLLRFLQGMQAYNTSKLADTYYRERKAGFPNVEAGKNVISVIGGAQFAQGQGGRKVAKSLEMIDPDSIYLPVENLETDKTAKTQKYDQLADRILGAFAPSLKGDKSMYDTIVNSVRQGLFALDPTARSTAAAQAIANTKLAQDQGAAGKAVSFSLGGADAVRYAQTANYMKLKQTEAFALSYPFLNFTQNTPNFKAGLLNTDPLSFPHLLGASFLNDQQILADSGELAQMNINSHAGHHLFKDPKFNEQFYGFLGRNPVSSSTSDIAGAYEKGSNLYEFLGNFEQAKSLLTQGEFDLQSQFKGYAGEQSIADIFGKFGETANYIGKLKGNRLTNSYGKQLEKVFEPLRKELVELFSQHGVDLSGVKTNDLAGFLKYTAEAPKINKAIQALLTGQLSGDSVIDDNFLQGLDPEKLNARTKEVVRGQTIKWFSDSTTGGIYGNYQDSLVSMYETFADLSDEFVKSKGKIPDDIKQQTKQYEAVNIPTQLQNFLDRRFDSFQLTPEEVARIGDKVPEIFKQKQVAILAYNKMLDSLGANIIPDINEIKAIASGMSGANALMSNDLVYKTDLDPEGAGKIASAQETETYKKLQGRFSPLLYAEKQGEALVTERVQGRSLKEILERIAQPYKKLNQTLTTLQGEKAGLDSEQDKDLINKLDQEITETRNKISREKTRFNKAASILYEQVGRLGASFESLGVIHGDLASGNVYFGDKGITSIDLGNSINRPTGMQKTIDRLRTQQRAIIDQSFYGLLDVGTVTSSIRKGYQNPLPDREVRQINPALLNQVKQGTAIPLGSNTGTLLEQTFGKIQKVLAEVEKPQKLSIPQSQPLSNSPAYRIPELSSLRNNQDLQGYLQGKVGSKNRFNVEQLRSISSALGLGVEGKRTELINKIVSQDLSQVIKTLSDNPKRLYNVIPNFSELNKTRGKIAQQPPDNFKKALTSLQADETAINQDPQKLNELINNAKRVKEQILERMAISTPEVAKQLSGLKLNISNLLDRSLNQLSQLAKQDPEQAKEIGRNIIKGLEQGIAQNAKGSIDEAGKLTRNLIEKVKSILEIRSPSRVFMRIGKQIVEGFEKGLDFDGIVTKMGREQKRIIQTAQISDKDKAYYRGFLDPSSPFYVTQPKQLKIKGVAGDFEQRYSQKYGAGGFDIGESMFNNNVAMKKFFGTTVGDGIYQSFDQAAEGVENFIDSTIATLPSVFELGSGISTIFDTIAQRSPQAARAFNFIGDAITSAIGLFGLNSAADLLGDFFRSTLESYTRLESIEIGLAFTQGSQVESQLNSIAQLSNDIGLNFEKAAAGFNKIAIAAEDTVLEPQVSYIFEGFSEGFATRQVNPLAQERALLALEQMISKETISTEEIRLQLAEALQGSVAVAGRSLGISRQELSARLRLGEVMASELLPRFGTQLSMESTVPLLNTKESFQASQNRLMSESFRSQAMIGEMVAPSTQVGIEGLSKVLKVLNDNAELVRPTLTGIVTLAGVKLTSSLYNVISSLKILDLTLQGLGIRTRYANTALSSSQILAYTSAPGGMGPTAPSNYFARGAKEFKGGLKQFITTTGGMLLQFGGTALAAGVAVESFASVLNDFNNQFKKQADLVARTNKNLSLQDDPSKTNRFVEAILNALSPTRSTLNVDTRQQVRINNSDLASPLGASLRTDAINRTIAEAKQYSDFVSSSLTANRGDIQTRLIDYDTQIRALTSEQINLQANAQNDEDYNRLTSVREEIARLERERGEYVKEQLGSFGSLGKNVEILQSQLTFLKENEADLRAIMTNEKYENTLSSLNEVLQKTIDLTEEYKQILNTTPSFAKQFIKDITGNRINFSAGRFQSQLAEDRNGIDIAQARLNNQLSSYQFQKAGVSNRINSANVRQQQAKAYSDGIKQAIESLPDDVRSNFKTKLGINNPAPLTDIIQNLAPDTLDSMASELSELADNDSLTTTEKKIIEQSQEYLNSLREQIQIKKEVVDLQLEDKELDRQRKADILTFQRSIEDLNSSIFNFFRQQQLEIKEFVRSIEEFTNQSNREARNLSEEYQELQTQINNKLIESTTALNQVRRDLEQRSDANELRSLVPPGGGSFVGELVNIVNSTFGFLNDYQNEEENLSLELLTIEQQRLETAKQIRGLQENAENLERTRLTQLQSLSNQQESFVISQVEAWRNITRQIEDTTLEAKKIYQSFSLIGGNMAQMANLYQGMFNKITTQSLAGEYQSPSSGNTVGNLGESMFVGYTGNTGRSTGPHLDIRARDASGNRINPQRFIDMFNVDGKPLSSYGVSSGYGAWEAFRTAPHAGIDFLTPTGLPIQFTGNGKIIAKKTPNETEGGGYVVEIQLDTGEIIQILHLASKTMKDVAVGNKTQPKVTPSQQPDPQTGRTSTKGKIIYSTEPFATKEEEDFNPKPRSRRPVNPPSKGLRNPLDKLKELINQLSGDQSFVGNEFLLASAGMSDIPLANQLQLNLGEAQPKKLLAQRSALNYEAILNNPNFKAFGDMIAWAEGTSKYPNSGYNTLFAGGQFSDMSRHPRKVVRANGYASTAAGRYQIMDETFDDFQKATGISDMSPLSQERFLAWRLQYRKALQAVLDGDIEKAIKLAGNEWASLPNNSYNQPQKKLNQLVEVYNKSLAQRINGPTSSPEYMPQQYIEFGEAQWQDSVNQSKEQLVPVTTIEADQLAKNNEFNAQVKAQELQVKQELSIEGLISQLLDQRDRTVDLYTKLENYRQQTSDQARSERLQFEQMQAQNKGYLTQAEELRFAMEEETSRRLDVVSAYEREINEIAKMAGTNTKVMQALNEQILKLEDQSSFLTGEAAIKQQELILSLQKAQETLGLTTAEALDRSIELTKMKDEVESGGNDPTRERSQRLGFAIENMDFIASLSSTMEGMISNRDYVGGLNMQRANAIAQVQVEFFRLDQQLQDFAKTTGMSDGALSELRGNLQNLSEEEIKRLNSELTVFGQQVKPIVRDVVQGLSTILLDPSLSIGEKLGNIAISAATSVANNFASMFTDYFTDWMSEGLQGILPNLYNRESNNLAGSDSVIQELLSTEISTAVELNAAALNLNQAASRLAMSLGGRSVGGGIGSSLLGDGLSTATGGFFGNNPIGGLFGSFDIASTPFALGTDFSNPIANTASNIALSLFNKGGPIKKAMQKEKLLSGGRTPRLIVANEGEYILPANPTQKDISRMIASVPNLRRNQKIENYAYGGSVGSNTGATMGINYMNNNSRNTQTSNYNKVYNLTSNLVVNGGSKDFGRTEYEMYRKQNQELARQANRY